MNFGGRFLRYGAVVVRPDSQSKLKIDTRIRSIRIVIAIADACDIDPSGKRYVVVLQKTVQGFITGSIVVATMAFVVADRAIDTLFESVFEHLFLVHDPAQVQKGRE